MGSVASVCRGSLLYVESKSQAGYVAWPPAIEAETQDTMSEERAKDRWRRKVEERKQERAQGVPRGEKRRQLELKEHAKMLKERLVNGNPEQQPWSDFSTEIGAEFAAVYDRNERSPSPPEVFVPPAPKKMPRKANAKSDAKTEGHTSSSASSRSMPFMPLLPKPDQTTPAETIDRDLMQPGSIHAARVAHYTLGHYGMHNGHRIMYYNKDGSFTRSDDEDMD